MKGRASADKSGRRCLYTPGRYTSLTWSAGPPHLRRAGAGYCRKNRAFCASSVVFGRRSVFLFYHSLSRGFLCRPQPLPLLLSPLRHLRCLGTLSLPNNPLPFTSPATRPSSWRPFSDVKSLHFHPTCLRSRSLFVAHAVRHVAAQQKTVEAWTLAVSKDDKLLASGTQKGSVNLWALDGHKKVFSACVSWFEFYRMISSGGIDRAERFAQALDVGRAGRKTSACS